MSDVLKTVKIMPSHKSQGAFIEINESDFNPQKHKLYGAAPVAPPAPVAVDTPPPPAPVAVEGEDEPKATAKAIEIATEAGIDLSCVVGTGKNGKVTAEDVEAAIEKLTAPESDNK